MDTIIQTSKTSSSSSSSSNSTSRRPYGGPRPGSAHVWIKPAHDYLIEPQTVGYVNAALQQSDSHFLGAVGQLCIRLRSILQFADGVPDEMIMKKFSTWSGGVYETMFNRWVTVTRYKPSPTSDDYPFGFTPDAPVTDVATAVSGRLFRTAPASTSRAGSQATSEVQHKKASSSPSPAPSPVASPPSSRTPVTTSPATVPSSSAESPSSLCDAFLARSGASSSSHSHGSRSQSTTSESTSAACDGIAEFVTSRSQSPSRARSDPQASPASSSTCAAPQSAPPQVSTSSRQSQRPPAVTTSATSRRRSHRHREPSPSSRSPSPPSPSSPRPPRRRRRSRSPSESRSPSRSSKDEEQDQTTKEKTQDVPANDDDTRPLTVTVSSATTRTIREAIKAFSASKKTAYDPRRPAVTSAPSVAVREDHLAHVAVNQGRIETSVTVEYGVAVEPDVIPWYDLTARLYRWFSDNFTTSRTTVSFAGSALSPTVHTVERPNSLICNALNSTLANSFWADHDFTVENLAICKSRVANMSNTVAIPAEMTEMWARLPYTSANAAWKIRRSAATVPPAVAYVFGIIVCVFSAIFEEFFRGFAPLLSTLLYCALEVRRTRIFMPLLVHFSLCLIVFNSIPQLAPPIPPTQFERLQAFATNRYCDLIWLARFNLDINSPYVDYMCKPVIPVLPPWYIHWSLLTTTDLFVAIASVRISIVLHIFLNVLCVSLGWTPYSVLSGIFTWLSRGIKSVKSRIKRLRFLKYRIDFSSAWNRLPKYGPDLPVPNQSYTIDRGAKFTWRGAKYERVTAPPSIYQASIAVPAYRPVVFANDVENQALSFKHRMLKATPVPDSSYLDGFIKYSRAAVPQLLPHAVAIPVKTHVSIHEFLTRTNAKGATLLALRRAAAELIEEHFDFDAPIDPIMASRMMSHTAFVKVETLALRNQYVVKPKTPRMIQSLGARASVIIGCAMMAVADRAKRDLNGDNHICMASGMSTSQTARVLTSGWNNFFKNDVSTFDTSVNSKITEFEVELAVMFHCPRAVIDLMKANVNLRGSTNAGWTFFDAARGSQVIHTPPSSTQSSTCYSTSTSSMLSQVIPPKLSNGKSACSSSVTTTPWLYRIATNTSTLIKGFYDSGSSLKARIARFSTSSFVRCAYILLLVVMSLGPSLASYSQSLDFSLTHRCPFIQNRSSAALTCPSRQLLVSANHSISCSDTSSLSPAAQTLTTPLEVTGKCRFPLRYQTPEHSTLSANGMGGALVWPLNFVPNCQGQLSEVSSIKASSNTLLHVTSTKSLVTTQSPGHDVHHVNTCPTVNTGALGACADGLGRSDDHPKRDQVGNVGHRAKFSEPHIAANTKQPQLDDLGSHNNVRGRGSIAVQACDITAFPKMMSTKSKPQRRARAKTSKPTIHRARSTITGRGTYSIGDLAKDVSNVVTYKPSTGVGRAVQAGVSTLANSAGIPSWLAEPLGNASSWLTKLIGFGRYDNIRSNSLVNLARGNDSGFKTNAPISFKNGRLGSDGIFAHEELIAPVYGTTDFSSTTYLINPGNPTLFPGGNLFMRNYEEYQPLGIVFQYIPSSGQYSGVGSAALGTVAMAMDYDVTDDNFTSLMTMSNAEYSVQDVSCNHLFAPVECAQSRQATNKLYVTDATTVGGVGEPLFHFHSRLTIATQGQPTTSQIGWLKAIYHFRMSKPIVESTTSYRTFSAFQQTALVSGSFNTLTSTCSDATWTRTIGPRGAGGVALTLSSTAPLVGDYVITGISSANGASTWDSSDLSTTFTGSFSQSNHLYTSTGSANAWAVCNLNGPLASWSILFRCDSGHPGSIVVRLPTADVPTYYNICVNGIDTSVLPTVTAPISRRDRNAERTRAVQSAQSRLADAATIPPRPVPAPLTVSDGPPGFISVDRLPAAAAARR